MTLPIIEHRSVIKQQPPPSKFSLRGFPAKRIPAGRKVFRQHKEKYQPWYFSNNDGRFTLDPPRGSLYLTSTAKAAALEHVGQNCAKLGWIDAGLVTGRVISELELPHAVKLAYCTSQKAIKWRIIVNELSTMPDYKTPRMWAKSFEEAGFDGIWTTLRFSVPQARSLILFGESGVRDWPIADTRSLREVCEAIGIYVVDDPASTALTVLRPSV